MTVLAFDVYATLINTYGMVDLLQRYIGNDRAMPFATLWRDKQLEYSFRRSMMGDYEPFYTCTADALNYCVEAFGVQLTDDQHFSLLKRYQNLPPYRDVIPCLESLSGRSDIAIYALTNGPLEDISRLFADDAIEDYFRDIVSCDEIRTYKPDPAVYRHFLERSGAEAKDCWLISGNSFDCIGAAHVGFNTVWVKRYDAQLYDPWGPRPTATLQSLSELEALF